MFFQEAGKTNAVRPVKSLILNREIKRQKERLTVILNHEISILSRLSPEKWNISFPS
jgi:hypothetical protein